MAARNKCTGPGRSAAPAVLLVQFSNKFGHSVGFTFDYDLIQRRTANAVECPSPVHLLRAAITGISENTKFQFEVVDPLNIPT